MNKQRDIDQPQHPNEANLGAPYRTSGPLRHALVGTMFGLFLALASAQAQQSPVVVYESLLDDIFFSDDNGTIAFTEL
ncbi:MAG: hypothetical protein AAGA95_14680, partial [Pseudomonadota bacterium]